MERGCFPSNRHQGWDKNGSPIVTLATATRLGSGDWTQEYEGHKVLHTLKQVETSVGQAGVRGGHLGGFAALTSLLKLDLEGNSGPVCSSLPPALPTLSSNSWYPRRLHIHTYYFPEARPLYLIPDTSPSTNIY